MWRAVVVLFQLWALARPDAAAVAPQDCSLECIRQGRPACEYCRVTREDIKQALGLNSIRSFGSCIPWPCLELLGDEDPQICQHYVHAPIDVKIEFLNEPNPKSDTAVVSWKPSPYGITFLRGFQVSVQALGSFTFSCQLFLFHRNVSLSPSDTQTLYKSDPFTGLSLGSQYAVTVMALPVPEQWEKFYQTKFFSTRSCAEKNGLDQCKQDWYPKHVEVQQEGSVITVTFNLAPPSLGIRSYFCLCYASGMKKYTDVEPDLSVNKTHHCLQLTGLREGVTYSCEIGANEIDAVRKTFNFHVLPTQKDPPPSEDASDPASLAMVVPLCLVVVFILGLSLAALIRLKSKTHRKNLEIKPEVIRLQEENETKEEVMSLPRARLTPPRLLICYSSCDEPCHVNAVVHLAAFIQQHMATQVCLDLWDSLSIAEEGSMAWHCRQIRDSDFILVMCSQGFGTRRDPVEPGNNEEDDEEEEAAGLRSHSHISEAVVRLIGEEVGRTKARGRDLSRYMAAVFEYSEEMDIPTELRLVSHYKLTRDLPLLFSHLHGMALHRPGSYLKINHITEEGFASVPAGAALQRAIHEAGMVMRAKRPSD
ncbi:interleukin-17 receptor D [Austrofundulus limnaeus]|uniref:Interleukin-17 receptor D n=1 Tax=Austrofundulus limnaeus TaxID=52670 RepID=A0A2I4CB39_AUSLI|nr:PREDICTED: interleukin-17 receptor D-like [Austrofundulus limnaeus]